MANESSDALDSLLEKLRNGDPISRRAARRLPAANAQPSAQLSLALEKTLPSGDETVDAARDLLAQLQSNGFKPPISLTVSSTPRRRRRRTETASNGGEMPGSPLATEIHDIREESEAA